MNVLKCTVLSSTLAFCTKCLGMTCLCYVKCVIYVVSKSVLWSCFLELNLKKLQFLKSEMCVKKKTVG